jgi:hypothetical protein
LKPVRKKSSKAVPVRDMKTHRRSRTIALPLLKLGTRWR